MTCSESAFRKWCKEEFPGCFVVKWPDFKVTGLSHSAGVPDFLVVWGGKVWFVEVKKFNSRTFTPAQKKVFKKIISNGGFVWVWVKLKRGHSYYRYEV
jgi:predicted type IV restriction endonuclease